MAGLLYLHIFSVYATSQSKINLPNDFPILLDSSSQVVSVPLGR